MDVQHWMTFGTFAEQRFFIYPSPETYFGIIINASMAAHAPDGIAAFLLEKNRSGINYIIDPMLHAFQHDPTHVMSFNEKTKDFQLKSSVGALADEYGSLIKRSAGKRAILPGDFSDDAVLNEMVENCLSFQKNHISERMQSSNTNLKYLETPPDSLLPYALVTPYFYLTEVSSSEWLPIMNKIVRMSRDSKHARGLKLFGSIVIKGNLLHTPRLKRLLADIMEWDVDGYLLWVDNLDEHDSDYESLAGLQNLSRELRRNGTREVINIHGGYFSILSANNELAPSCFSGISHGPEYGEMRAVIPVGGGIPISRFYIRDLHMRVRFRDALYYLSRKEYLANSSIFYEQVCDCDQCRETIQNDIANFNKYGETVTKLVKRRNSYASIEYSTKETKERALRHYLQMKQTEFQFISSSSASDITNDLDVGIEKYKEVAGEDGVSHLKLWRLVIEKEARPFWY